jgi:hypothetical protein
LIGVWESSLFKKKRMKGVFDIFCNIDNENGTGILKWENENEKNNCFKMNFQASMGILMDENLKDEELKTELVPCLEILPFICCKSPIIAMIQYNDKEPNISLITTTFKSFTCLFEVKKYLLAFVYDMKNKQQKYLKQFEGDLQVFYKKVRENNITKDHENFKACMNDFGNMLKKYTFQRIHIYERQIYNCITQLSPKGNEIQFRCTPIDNIPNNLKSKANASLDVISFFQQKQKTISNLLKDCNFINVENLEKNVRLGKNLYDDLIPYETLWEYALLMDKNNIIQ